MEPTTAQFHNEPMPDLSILVAMSDGQKHDLRLSSAEFDSVLRTNSRLVSLPLRQGGEVWLNPAHIVSAIVRDADQVPPSTT